MAKETFYFPHDFEPTSDPKIQALIGTYGGVGYGAFWRFVEMLHSNPEHRLPHKKYIIQAIAKQMLTSAEQIEQLLNDCIENYELFASDGDFFWSDRVNRNFERRLEISQIRSESGKKGAIAKQTQAIAKQNEAKESKVKEIKGKKIESKEKSNSSKKPSVLELENYFTEKAQSWNPDKVKTQATKFFNHYEANGWKVGKNPMKSWQAAASGWVSRDAEYNNQDKTRKGGQFVA